MATPKKPTAKAATTRRKVAGIKVNFFTLGDDAKEIGVKKDSTLADFRVARGLEGIKLQVNGAKQSETYVLQAGDRITVIPEAKGGNQ